MRLILHHDGDPSQARIVNAETGEVLEGVKSYSLDRPGPSPVEHLTVTVVLTPPDLRRERHRAPDPFAFAPQTAH